MSKEEIIEIIKDYIDNGMTDKTVKMDTIIYLNEAIKGLYDLYFEEKEKNKKIKNPRLYVVGRRTGKEASQKIIVKEYISIEKIKEKIEELENEYKQLEETSDFIIADTIQPKIQVLQELLEEEK